MLEETFLFDFPHPWINAKGLDSQNKCMSKRQVPVNLFAKSHQP